MTKTRTDIVVVEATVVAVPVEVPAHGAFVELMHDKVTGLLHRARDAGSLAECLRRVVGREDRNRERNATCRRYYEARSTHETGLANRVAGCDAAIAGRPPEPR